METEVGTQNNPEKVNQSELQSEQETSGTISPTDKNQVEQHGASDEEYPSGIKLGLILVALSLGVVFVSLDMVCYSS